MVSEGRLSVSAVNIINYKVVLQDHFAAQSLVGPNSANLQIIEDRVPVQMRLCGNELWIHGVKSDVSKVTALLKTIYRWACDGRAVSAEDVRDLLAAECDNRHSEAAFFVGKKAVYARKAKQKKLVDVLQSCDVSFAIGPAGTGKTYLSVAYGVRCLLAHQVKKLVLSRPAVEAGEKIGFLPGDMRDKVDPYMRPLYDVLRDFLDETRIQRLLDEGAIEIAPLAFMRGRTLANSFIVLDEAQNASHMQMKMFLTRLGENSSMVITGDPLQVDLQRQTDSGLLDAQKRLSNIQGVGSVYFDQSDVVRHGLVSEIIKAYENNR